MKRIVDQQLCLDCKLNENLFSFLLFRAAFVVICKKFAKFLLKSQLTLSGEQANKYLLAMPWPTWNASCLNIYAMLFLGQTHSIICWVRLSGKLVNVHVTSRKCRQTGNLLADSQIYDKMSKKRFSKINVIIDKHL